MKNTLIGVTLFMLGLIVFISTPDFMWHQEAIQAGVAEYNHTTGKFQFIKIVVGSNVTPTDFTVSKEIHIKD